MPVLFVCQDNPFAATLCIISFLLIIITLQSGIVLPPLFPENHGQFFLCDLDILVKICAQ